MSFEAPSFCHSITLRYSAQLGASTGSRSPPDCRGTAWHKVWTLPCTLGNSHSSGTARFVCWGGIKGVRG